MTHGNSCELSIVMPCLNESETLEALYRKSPGFFETAEYPRRSRRSRQWQSGWIARNCPSGRSPGGGCSTARSRIGVLGGITNAQGDYVIMGDADDSYDFTALMPFLEKLREGFELVMGDRFAGGIKPEPCLSFIVIWKNLSEAFLGDRC